MDVKLLRPKDWMTTKENINRIQTQKAILKNYTSAQKKQLVAELSNTYPVYQVVIALNNHINAYLNTLYTKMRKDTLTPSAKKDLLHKVKINRTVARKMDVEGHPCDSAPFYKPTVDNGKFAKELYDAMQNTVNKQMFHRCINWYSFLEDQYEVRLDNFPSVSKRYQKEYYHALDVQRKKRFKKHCLLYRLASFI